MMVVLEMQDGRRVGLDPYHVIRIAEITMNEEDTPEKPGRKDIPFLEITLINGGTFAIPDAKREAFDFIHKRRGDDYGENVLMLTE